MTVKKSSPASQTLYRNLKEMNRAKKNILTIEMCVFFLSWNSNDISAIEEANRLREVSVLTVRFYLIYLLH